MSENNKQQIIYVWNYIGWGGAQIYFFALMREAKKYYRVTVMLPKNSKQRIFDHLDELGVEYELLPPRTDAIPADDLLGKLAVHFRWAADERAMVRQLVKKIKPDDTLIHIDIGFWQSFTTLMRLSLKTPVFVTIHTALPRLTLRRRSAWKIKGELLSRLKNFHILTSNIDAKRSLAPYLSSGKESEIEVAYSGFDQQEIERILSVNKDPQLVREKYGLPKDRTLIVTVGQFIERKGCWVLLEALRNLRARSAGFCFLWLATSAPDAHVKEEINSYGLTDCFRLMSSEEIGTTRDDLLRLVHNADLFVLPSLEEGLPIALVEAMALGKACIATRINAIPEAIEDRQNGLLVEAVDSSLLADAIFELVEDPDLRERLGASAQETAFAKFSALPGAKLTIEMYARAFSGRH